VTVLKNLSSIRFYRIATVLGLLIAIVLVLAVPQRFQEPDDWAYYYATENLSHGRLTVDNALHQQQVADAQRQGGQLIQYIDIGDNRWAFEKAPGYVYYLIPFYLAGVPQLGNILLAAGLVAVTYLLLKRLKDEKTACLGSLLVLFTPTSLAMLQREYMDSFAGAAFVGIGGGLYILYCLRAREVKSVTAMLFLFLAGLFLAWGVAARYTNATVAGVFGLHFLITRVKLLFSGQGRGVLREALPLGLGALIPIALLLSYQQAVFGSPWAYGYEYTKLNVRFAFDYLGEPRAWEIISLNLDHMRLPLLIGFPLLMIALPATVIIYYQKSVSVYRKHPDPWAGISWDILLLLTGWIAAVFGLYLMYEWTASSAAVNTFIIVTRFYLPAIMPLSVLAALALSRLSGKLVLGVMIIITILGVAFFAQAALTELGKQPPPQSPSREASLPPVEVERLISQTRQEVKAGATNPDNLRRRLDVMVMWIGQLDQQGYAVGEVMPKVEVEHIENLFRDGKLGEACRIVDEAYRKLGTMVATGP
jgi:hypothetical protein